MRVCVFSGSSPGRGDAYLAAARDFARFLVDSGVDLVYGGAAVGTMGAIADAALDAGGTVLGVIPRQLVDREIAHPGLSELHVVADMHERKALMASLADAFVALPGGAGTLEELFEVWTWGQIGLHEKPVGLLDVAGYFQPLVRFLDHMVAAGFLHRDHRDMLMVDDDPRRLLDGFATYAPPPSKWVSSPPGTLADASSGAQRWLEPQPTRRAARLRAGDTVGVVAPAGPVPDETLDAGVAVLRSWGLDVRLGAHVRDRHPGLDYLAGADADRAADLRNAWCDPEIAAVFCARGGYGSLRLLDALDWTAMQSLPPKAFVGSSDVTALHNVMGARLGVATFFAPMIGTDAFVDDPLAQEHLRTMLFEPESATVLRGTHTETLVPGTATGPLIGGNLSLLVSAQGVADVPPPPAGAVALLEDVGEEPYRIDRFLTHLRRAGWFERVSGVALGSWTDCGDPAVARAVLRDRLGDLGIPVVWELGFGHCKGQLTVPLGVEAELDATAGTLKLAEPALL